MYYLKSINKTLVAAISLLIVATGCSISDSNNAGPKPVSVTMQVTGSSSQKSLTSNHVTLTSVKLLVEEIELESVEEDSLDFEVENQVVELPLDGSSYQLSTENISLGFFDEFELEVDGIDEDDNVNDPDFTEGSNETSIVIKGTYNGEDFTFKSEEDFELEFEFNPPIEISETTNSVAIDLMVDVSSWFVDGSGNDLDPTDPNNHDQIEENINNSFDAEDDIDDDEDDEDDEDDN